MQPLDCQNVLAESGVGPSAINPIRAVAGTLTVCPDLNLIGTSGGACQAISGDILIPSIYIGTQLSHFVGPQDGHYPLDSGIHRRLIKMTIGNRSLQVDHDTVTILIWVID